jgi:hypothetical protein
MFEQYSELKQISAQAELLAVDNDWPILYDEVQLSKNEVPVYAAVYMDDMYVDFGLSMETASKVKGCKTYVTNSLYHTAVRAKTEAVMNAVFALRDDTID